MIKIEYPYNNNSNLIRHYSDEKFKIRQIETSIIYDEAVDLYPCRYTYEETDIPRDDYDNDSNEPIDN